MNDLHASEEERVDRLAGLGIVVPVGDLDKISEGVVTGDEVMGGIGVQVVLPGETSPIVPFVNNRDTGPPAVYTRTNSDSSQQQVE